jgi:hypothetical protein
MKKEDALKEIVREWLRSVPAKERTENNSVLFAFRMLKDRPDLTDFRDTGDKYQTIKARLSHHLTDLRLLVPYKNAKQGGK